MKTAIQLYTLRNRLSEGVEKVLKEIREMGYEGVEWYYLPDNSPEKAAELSKAAGLEIFSAHIDINIVLAGDRELLKRLAKAGFKYLPIGWLPGAFGRWSSVCGNLRCNPDLCGNGQGRGAVCDVSQP